MNNTIYQAIFNKLQEYLPANWDEVVFYAAYAEGSYSMKYYVKKGTEITSCFNLMNVSKAQLVKLFMSIDRELVAERKSLPTKDLWSVMTMVIGADGNMKTHYDFTNICENSISFEKAWEDKYL